MLLRDLHGFRRQSVLVVTRRAATGDDPAFARVAAALDAARIAWTALDLGAAPSLAGLDRHSAVVLATDRLQEIDELSVRRLSDFVANGGGLVAAVPLWHHKLAPLLGVERCLGRQSDDHSSPLDTTIEFVTDFLPGLGGLRAELPFPEGNLALTLVPDDDVRVLAEDGEGDPVAWVRRFGRGQVVVWNTLLPIARFGAGLLVQSVLHAHRAALAPIANAGVFQIDDFPAGFSNLAAEPPLGEFGLRFVDFLRRIWLPDMLGIADEFDVTCTFFATFAYNGVTAPPFSFAEWEQLADGTGAERVPLPAVLAREVAGRHELGLHGYNHLPPTRDAWRDERHLAEALRAAVERWRLDGLGEAPRSYAPPMNEIDASGLRALAAGAPSVTTLCGHHLGDFDKGQARDFGPEPWSPRHFGLPRLTDGYELHPINRFFMASSLAATGIWTHFLHPDDVIDTRANFPERPSFRNEHGRLWRGSTCVSSYTSLLRDWLRFTRDRFPWLRYRSTSDARAIVEEHLRSRLEVELGDDRVRVRSEGPAELQLRLSEGDLDIVAEDGSVEIESSHRGDGYSLLTLRKAPGTSTLRLRSAARRAGRAATPEPPGPPASRVAARLRPGANDDEPPFALCFVADTKGWAFDNIAKNVSKHLPSRFDVEIKYRDAYESEAQLQRDLFLGPRRFDLVHWFWHPSLGFLFDPDVGFELLSPLDEERRRFVAGHVARTVKTTSVYSHQFLGEHESDRLRLTSLALADGYAVASSRLFERYGARDFLPRPTAVLPDGVDLERFRPFHLGRLADTRRTVRVGWAGNSAWGSTEDHKGLDTVIRPLLARFASVGLDVRGEFRDRRVEWTPHEQMPAYYSAIDVYVCASLDEGTPNPVLEAMASGLPVLSTDVGIVREVFGPLQREFVVGDRASAEFAEKLRRLVTDPDLRLRLGRENLESVRACSWEHRATLWDRFFSEVASRKRDDGSASRQAAELYRAFDAGRRLHFSRATPPALATATTGGPGAFLRNRLREHRSGTIDHATLLRHVGEVGRFLSLSLRGDHAVRRWCEERGLPRCYPAFDWWHYLASYDDLGRAGIETPDAAARHWLAYGRKEHRVLRPHGFASAVRWLRSLRRRATPTHAGPRPEVSVVVAGAPDDPRGRLAVDSVESQVGATVECLPVETERVADAEALNRAVLQARGDWVVPLAAGDRLSRPDSLRAALAAAAPDTELLVWRHGSSRGATPLPGLPHRILSDDEPVAGFAIRRRHRRRAVDDGYAGASSRQLRRLTRALRTEWIDDVLTDRVNGPEEVRRAAGHDLDLDLVLAFPSDVRTRETLRQSFWRERLYSFFLLEEPSAAAALAGILERRNGNRLLLLGPAARLGPHFRQRCEREAATWTPGDASLLLRPGGDVRATPLAVATHGAALRRLASRSGSLTFDRLLEALREDGRPLAMIDTELFQPLDG